MHDKNPLQVQFKPAERRTHATPLMLIHDGGGTTFSYFSLGSLHRDVWALHNPNFFSAEPWEGGMDEMAEAYIGLIEKAGIRGNIFLGGWSLGGFLSMTISRMLMDRPNPQFSVVGLVLIDSPYHIPRSKLDHVGPEPEIDGLPDLVRKQFENCDDLLEQWELPSWDGPTWDGKTVQTTTNGKTFCVPDGHVLYKPLDDRWHVKGTQAELEQPINCVSGSSDTSPHDVAAPPPAIMLRCVKHSPTKDESENPCHIDIFREDPLLGWDRNHQNFIKVVVDADSHHFNLFNFSQIPKVTAQLNECLRMLDNMLPVDA